MAEWWRYLKGKPFYWALDGSHPAAALFMLRHVVGRPENSTAMRAARLALREWKEIEVLWNRLARHPATLWEPRYRAPLWLLRLLAELESPGDDSRVAEALDGVLDKAADEREGSPHPVNGPTIVLHISSALGYAGETRLQAHVDRLRVALKTDALPPDPLERADWLVLAAMALAAQPEAGREASLVSLLAGPLQALDPATLGGYRAFGFPTFDRPDGLVLARSALRLKLSGAWLRPWVEQIVDAQDERGLWPLARALPTPSGFPTEVVGEPSRWITAQALYVLREFYGE